MSPVPSVPPFSWGALEQFLFKVFKKNNVIFSTNKILYKATNFKYLEITQTIFMKEEIKIRLN
jgi:hypothetical protein